MPPTAMNEVPLRLRLNAEFHARPPLPLSGATRIRHLAFLSGIDGAMPQRDYLDQIAGGNGWVISEQSESYCVVDRGLVRVRWELHTEFSSYTIFEPLGTESVGNLVDADDLEEWIRNIPGEAIVALRIDKRPAGEVNAEAMIADMASSEQQMVVSRIVDGKAWVFTDFQFVDGETSFLLVDAGMTRRQAGRTVQRLWEIETYRLLALLGLPVARQMGSWLRRAEEELAGLMDKIGSAKTLGDEHSVLNTLSLLAADVEHSVARTAFRFGASRAYHAIVMQRTGELREERVAGFPTLAEFMERRLAPPMNTCAAMALRQDELSARVARNSQLLRTRVDIGLERQSQELLGQMNQRARQQLHLQETVEGLSVVAITYYGSQLVHYLAEGGHVVGMGVNSEIVTALSIPLIAVGVWLGMRRLRKRTLA